MSQMMQMTGIHMIKIIGKWKMSNPKCVPALRFFVWVEAHCYENEMLTIDLRY